MSKWLHDHPPNVASLSRAADGMGGVWSDNQTGQLRELLL